MYFIDKGSSNLEGISYEAEDVKYYPQYQLYSGLKVFLMETPAWNITICDLQSTRESDIFFEISAMGQALLFDS